MRKRFLSVAGLLAIGAAVMFTSCSNDEDIVNPGVEQGIDGESQVLTLSIASSGDGLQTRAGRPLYSNEAAQKIDKVALFFVNSSNKIVLKKLVDWSTAQDYNDARGHGKELEIALKGEQKLEEDGLYTIYAVGYSNSSDYNFTPAVPTEDNATYNASSSDAWGTFSASLKEGKVDAEEVFAGSENIYVTDGSFELQTNGKKNGITLHRQIAGMTGYFTNIPVSVDGKRTASVRLVSVNKNKTAEFKYFNSDFATNKPVKYIVNGKDAADEDGTYADKTEAHVIYEIQLNDWFIGKNNSFAECDVNGDGFLGYEDVAEYIKQHPEFVVGNDGQYAIWRNPHYAEGVRFVRGSVFSGKFVIPFEKGDKNTLQLQLLDVNGDITKYWNINAAEVHTSVGSGGIGEKWDDSKSIYNIYRNHMYNVGMKAVINPDPEKPDPEKPDPDPEKPEDPEDLSKGQDLIIQVNDNWEVIHNMELD